MSAQYKQGRGKGLKIAFSIIRGFFPSSDENLDRSLQKLIIAIEDMPALDMGELGERTGLGGEASSIYNI